MAGRTTSKQSARDAAALAKQAQLEAAKKRERRVFIIGAVVVGAIVVAIVGAVLISKVLAGPVDLPKSVSRTTSGQSSLQ